MNCQTFVNIRQQIFIHISVNVFLEYKNLDIWYWMLGQYVIP